MATTSNQNDFSIDSNYNPASPFTRVKFGTNRPLLESELNEMQIIQDEARAAMMRRLAYSGFYTFALKGFSGDPIVYMPNNLPNSFAISPGELNVNGYKLTLQGNTTINGVNGYTLIQLDPPPTDTSYRYDLVFLEVWFEEFTDAVPVTEYGYVGGNIITPNPMIDTRVGELTSNRVGLQWRIRVADNVDFNTWPMGFGYASNISFSPIYALGANNTQVTNSNYIFISASDNTFSGEDFYQDSGLFVAGRPGSTSIATDLGVMNNYVFAMPLFKIFRRNSQTYSPTTNPYGADVWTPSTVRSSRYDGLYANVVDATDITDLRHTVLIADWSADEIHNKALSDLVTGDLQTAYNQEMNRAQFGVEAFQPSTNQSTIFYGPFDGSFDAQAMSVVSNILVGVMGTENGSADSSINRFRPSVSDFGLFLDGTFDVEYNQIPFNSNQGTLDFFVKPYWEGSDPSVAQTLVQITDDQKNPFFQLIKLSDRLSLINYQTAYTSNPLSTNIDMMFSDYPMDNNRFYHIRFAWSLNENVVNLYLDGVKVATSPYSQSKVIPTTLIVGKNIIINNPTTALTASVDSSIQNSLLGTGTYFFTYTYVTQTGETEAAPETSINLTVPYQGISLTIPSTMPAGISYVNVYMGTHSGQETLLTQWHPNSQMQSVVSVSSLPSVGSKNLPTINTASFPPDTLTPAGEGTIIDEMIAYNTALIYNYQASPQVPLDFTEGLATIYPSFNGLMRDFGDNAYEQSLLTMQYTPAANTSSFTVTTPLPNATFSADSSKMKVYTLGTYQTVPNFSQHESYIGTDSGIQFNGNWTGLGTDTITFTLGSGTFNGSTLQVQYSLAVDGGHGLLDLPGELLYATINTGASEQEASFNMYNSAPRYVNLFNPTSATATMSGTTFIKTDYAYDYATSNHGKGDAFARVLYHYVQGNNTIAYKLDTNFYGYDVMGIINAQCYTNNVKITTPLIEGVTYVPAAYDSNGNLVAKAYYSVNFASAIGSSTIVEFELALAGVTFDYNPYNKSVMSNIMKAENVTYYSQGSSQSLIFPVKTDPSSSEFGGCVVSYLKWSGSMNDTNIPSGYDLSQLYTVYVNNVATPVKINYIYFNTPFIAITFLNYKDGSPYIPPAGTKIDIPILHTYQPGSDKTLYVWYNKIPYQGIMTSETYNLKRITNWISFVTTLSSGNTYLSSENVNVIQLPKNSIYNAINRLPGGRGNAYIIEGMQVLTQNMSNNGPNVNTQFITSRDYSDLLGQQFDLDDYFLSLTTDLTVSKVEGNYQDSKTSMPFALTGFVLPDTINPVHKYAGASCVVMDENTNELMLFVFGSLQSLEAQKETIARAEFCDLFRIQGRPLIKIH